MGCLFLNFVKSPDQILIWFSFRLVLRKFVSSDLDPPDCSLASVVYGGSAGILAQLLELKSWFEDQTMFHFYSCSILMLYEKQLPVEKKTFRSQVKLVDFAHIVEGKGVIDHNFLGGLCSLIKFISEILTCPCPDEYAGKACLQDIETNWHDSWKLDQDKQVFHWYIFLSITPTYLYLHDFIYEIGSLYYLSTIGLNDWIFNWLNKWLADVSSYLLTVVHRLRGWNI